MDPLLWFVHFAMENYRRSWDAAHQQLRGLIQVWSSDGIYDQFDSGGVAAIKELARQIQSHVDAYSGLDHVCWSESPFHTGSRRRSCDGTLVGISRLSRRRNLLIHPLKDRCGGMIVAPAMSRAHPEAKFNLLVQVRQSVGELARGDFDDKKME